MPRKYEKVQELLPEIKGMLAEGYTQREIAEHFGLENKAVVVVCYSIAETLPCISRSSLTISSMISLAGFTS